MRRLLPFSVGLAVGLCLAALPSIAADIYTRPSGLAGTPGPTGAAGATGPTGAAGATGVAGPTGAAGATGTAGATGPTSFNAPTVDAGTIQTTTIAGDGGYFSGTVTAATFGLADGGTVCLDWPACNIHCSEISASEYRCYTPNHNGYFGFDGNVQILNNAGLSLSTMFFNGNADSMGTYDSQPFVLLNGGKFSAASAGITSDQVGTDSNAGGYGCTMSAGITCTLTDATLTPWSFLTCSEVSTVDGGESFTASAFAGAQVTPGVGATINAVTVNSGKWRCNRFN